MPTAPLIDPYGFAPISLPSVKLTWLHIGVNRTEVLGAVLDFGSRDGKLLATNPRKVLNL